MNLVDDVLIDARNLLRRGRLDAFDQALAKTKEMAQVRIDSASDAEVDRLLVELQDLRDQFTR